MQLVQLFEKKLFNLLSKDKKMDFKSTESDSKYARIDRFDDKTVKELEHHYREILRLIGEDPDREGLLKTPFRVAKSMLFLTQGYEMDPCEMLQSAIFTDEYREMIVVKDIVFYSMCEHHMIPFFGKAHVAYIPNGKLTGLSKIARVVNAYARRLQIQERMTTQIKECIQNALDPLGVAVVVEAQHLCMQMRGVESPNSVTTTSDFTGAFKNNVTRNEFLNLIGHKFH